MKHRDSKLTPFTTQIAKWREEGVSLRKMAEILREEHGLEVSYNAIHSFVKTRETETLSQQLFYEGLPPDIQQALIQQLTALWTFNSTGMEGNTLTLGETVKVLEQGLTISGKPLKDHEEVYGHAKAIDLIYEFIGKPALQKEDLFNLHRCVMQKSGIDAMRPVGDWKRDYNGTNGVENGQAVYMEYASPMDTPKLMGRWLKEFNQKLNSATSQTKAINVYAWSHLSFVRIHPFFDGNGRVARLLANLPLLRGGHPPLLISQQRRAEYIDLLWQYERSTGVIQARDRMLPANESLSAFKALLRAEWHHAVMLVAQANDQASKR